jgi:hypothetical protein
MDGITIITIQLAMIQIMLLFILIEIRRNKWNYHDMKYLYYLTYKAERM